MKVRLTLAALCAGMAGTAFSLEEPIYTVTTSGTGTTNLDGAQVEVTTGGETTTVAFDTLAPTTGTFRKRGTGYLLSSDRMSGFKGTILIEEGAFIAQKNGHLGPGGSKSTTVKTAHVVVSNGASLVVSGNADSGTFFVGNTIAFSGQGYQNRGAISIGVTQTQNFLFSRSTFELLGPATIGWVARSTAYIYNSTLTMNGHMLTIRNVTEEARGSTQGFEGNTILSPGHIYIDGIWFRPWGGGNNFNGTAENTLTIDGASGEYYPSQHVRPVDKWTLVLATGALLERTYNAAEALDSYSKTNSYGWAGPVRLAGTARFIWTGGATEKKGFTFLGPVSGPGGFNTDRSCRINLVDGANSFEGKVTLNRNRHAGSNELRVFWPGALPAESEGVTFLDSDLTLMYSRTYDLPPLTFDVTKGMTGSFSGGTNGTVRSLTKINAGLLDMTAPLTVTGVTELAGGTLRLPCDRAGLTLGWREQPVGNSNKDISNLNYVFTNKVELGTDIAYSFDLVEWRRLVENPRTLFTYCGQIWNRTEAPQDWTFAAQVMMGMQIYIDGQLCEWENLKYWEFNAYKSVGFVTIRNVQPGPHRIDVRIYTTYNDESPSTRYTDYGPLANSRGVSAITNATWTLDFALGIDRQGRGSTNYEDYEKLVDPGDGSFLTLTADGDVGGVIAHMPKFDHLKFTGGTLDTRGSDITVPVLEGANGAVTNSNAYFPGGSLTVGETWRLSGSAVSGKTLKIYGKLKFAAGAALDWEDLALLPRTEQTLATATDGIEGLPAFDGNAPGNKGWHLKKATVNGVETLTFFWQLGTMFTIR